MWPPLAVLLLVGRWHLLTRVPSMYSETYPSQIELNGDSLFVFLTTLFFVVGFQPTGKDRKGVINEEITKLHK